MHVDETRAHKQPVRIDGSGCPFVGQAAHSCYSIADDADVGTHPRVPCPIDQLPRTDQNVEHTDIKPCAFGGLPFGPAAVTSSAYLFAHDVLDETAAVVLDRLEQAGLNEAAMAAAYHHSRDV